MLANLKMDDSIQEQGDSLGGSVLDSGIYDMVIDMAYIDISKNGAYGLVCSFRGANGVSHKETFWMTNTEAKGCLNYYVDKSGAKQYLPGFNQANTLALLTTGMNISDLEPEKKTIKVYNYELKKEVPTEKQVVTAMLQQPIKIGLVKQIVDKTKKNPATGAYDPTGETREENEIHKLFDAENGCTVAELRAGATVPYFLEGWENKWKGQVRNRAKGTKGDSGTAGAPASPGAMKKPGSLFGKSEA